MTPLIVSNGCVLKRVERGKDAKLQEVLFAVYNSDVSVTERRGGGVRPCEGNPCETVHVIFCHPEKRSKVFFVSPKINQHLILK